VRDSSTERSPGSWISLMGPSCQGRRHRGESPREHGGTGVRVGHDSKRWSCPAPGASARAGTAPPRLLWESTASTGGPDAKACFDGRGGPHRRGGMSGGRCAPRAGPRRGGTVQRRFRGAAGSGRGGRRDDPRGRLRGVHRGMVRARRRGGGRRRDRGRADPAAGTPPPLIPGRRGAQGAGTPRGRRRPARRRRRSPTVTGVLPRPGGELVVTRVCGVGGDRPWNCH
jgi:hypothetical protein